MHTSTDTIAAIATPPGQGGVGIVRISGADVPAIAVQLFGRMPVERQAELHNFHDAQGELIDNGLVLYFPAPASFTGEHVLELQGHGGPVVMDLLLARIMSLGARLARPGEFSERAFLNGKLDLAQAEAIADLIASGTATAARAATRSLQGAFSSRVHDLVEQLTRLRMYIEAAMDFPDEEIDFLADAAVLTQLDELQSACAGLRSSAHQGCLLRDGLTLVIAGRPNAGKSSLMNALAGRETAIVTDIPGTTRDVLREQIQLDGLPLHLIDTAGLHDSEDPVELAGMERTRAALGQADQILLVVDDTAGFTAADTALLEDLPADVPCLRVYNKIDLSGRTPGVVTGADTAAVALSVKTGAGMDALSFQILSTVGYAEHSEGSFTARRRHLDALTRASDLIDSGRRQLEQQQSGELLAEELRLAQQALGEITGEFGSEDLLGRIFSDFCIGK
jgi:tRNA modification GTPase